MFLAVCGGGDAAGASGGGGSLGKVGPVRSVNPGDLIAVIVGKRTHSVVFVGYWLLAVGCCAVLAALLQLSTTRCHRKQTLEFRSLRPG